MPLDSLQDPPQLPFLLRSEEPTQVTPNTLPSPLPSPKNPPSRFFGKNCRHHAAARGTGHGRSQRPGAGRAAARRVAVAGGGPRGL